MPERRDRSIPIVGIDLRHPARHDRRVTSRVVPMAQEGESARARVTPPAELPTAANPEHTTIVRRLLIRWGLSISDQAAFDRLAATLGGLPEEHYALLRERMVKGRSAQDVGDQIGLSRQGINQREKTMIKTLREKSGIAPPKEKTAFSKLAPDALREALLAIQEKRGYTVDELSAITGFSPDKIQEVIGSEEGAEDVGVMPISSPVPPMAHGREGIDARVGEIAELFATQGGYIHPWQVEEIAYAYRTNVSTVKRDVTRQRRIMDTKGERGTSTLRRPNDSISVLVTPSEGVSSVVDVFDAADADSGFATSEVPLYTRNAARRDAPASSRTKTMGK